MKKEEKQRIKHFFSIGEASKLTGISVQTLRIWHKKQKLVPVYISESAHRYYSKYQVEQIMEHKKKKKKIESQEDGAIMQAVLSFLKEINLPYEINTNEKQIQVIIHTKEVKKEMSR